ncbi:unnamed protein product [Ceutorhynchus assimilis]|uniref:Transcription factor TFIIIC triple barrel domain-containing protein n=1 Tax=Ceutorhynchus assimilis TaxID=467358 RepID=A0A9N9QLX5_9CUCU|nr:unnamed protein product [Ceutorhynchus assimilis]
MDENTEKDKLVFLDFNDKLSNEIIKDKVFIRIANLEDKNPLVQVNDIIFEGTYDYSLGTNLFFEKGPNEEHGEFPFKEPLEFKLNFLTAQTKVLNCTQMKVPSTAVAAAPLPETQTRQDNLKFNFNWEYKELLEKFENGTLDLQDMISPKNDTQKDTDSAKNDTSERNIEPEIEPEPRPEPMETEGNRILDDNMEVFEIQDIGDPETTHEPELQDNLKNAYERLLLLARTPVKRVVEEEECVCDPKYKKEYDYRSTECKVLEPPLFSYIQSSTTPETTQINNYENHINLDRCVALGLLKPLDACPRMLTKKEQDQVMTVENFENLDLTARYLVLQAHMKELEKQVESNSSIKNSELDEFGRTPVETLHIFKKLASALSRRIDEISSIKN